MLANVMYNQWAALGILFVIGALFAIFNIVVSRSLGPRRLGKVKETPYESGVDPMGDTHRRFNVRFFLVAMIFLVFDVEVLFLIPWTTIFVDAKNLGITAPLFWSMISFVAVVLVAYLYAWGKGVLKWD